MAAKTHWQRSEFLGVLPVQDVKFHLSRPRQVSGTRGGEILTAEASVALWQGSVTLAPMPARAAAAVEVMLAELEAPGCTFDAYKPNQIGPAADPIGASLAGFSAVIEEVGSDGQTIRLGGLPIGYQVSVGDFLSFTYDGGTRQALHRVAAGAFHTEASAIRDFTSSGFLRISPSLRPGLVVGSDVELVRPYCRAQLVPGSVSYGSTRNNKTSGMAFDFRQTLRVF